MVDTKLHIRTKGHIPIFKQYKVCDHYYRIPDTVSSIKDIIQRYGDVVVDIISVTQQGATIHVRYLYRSFEDESYSIPVIVNHENYYLFMWMKRYTSVNKLEKFRVSPYGNRTLYVIKDTNFNKIVRQVKRHKSLLYSYVILNVDTDEITLIGGDII